MFGELISGAKCSTNPICQTLKRKVGQATRQDKDGDSDLQSVGIDVPHFQLDGAGMSFPRWFGQNLGRRQSIIISPE